MICNTIGLTADSFESIYVTGGAEVAEVYGGLNYADPIFYKTQTMTGSAPLVFDAYPGSIRSYTISGNTVQNGTPTPEAPVDVVGCGARTGNLFDYTDLEGGYIDPYTGGDLPDSGQKRTKNYIAVQANTEYTLSNYNGECRIHQYSSSSYLGSVLSDEPQYSFTTNSNCTRIRISGTKDNFLETTMLNAGSTALPYEPYGYKIPITCGGETKNIYLGQVETTRRVKKLVLDGTEGWQNYGYAYNTYRLSISSAQSIGNPAICSHFVNSPISEITSGKFTVGSTWIYICYADVADLADFKSYLAAQYSAGTPVTVWYVLDEPETSIVNEPIHKIGGYADTITMAQAGETIPTIAGSNTLTVGATVQPSSVSITGHIKPTTP